MEKRKRAVRWLFFLFSGNTFSKAWWIYLKKKVIISNFAHSFCLCTLKIQHLTGIQSLKLPLFRPYAARSCVFNKTGNVSINASTNSLIVSSVSSVLSLSMARNI